MSNVHASTSGEYIGRLLHSNRTSFEECKRRLEDECASWATRSKKTTQNCTVHYLRCSRALPNSLYAETNKENTKKVVRNCTSFMRVIERPECVEVEYCRSHCGHEKEPALLTMESTSESYIVSLLKDGFKYNQVLRKVGDSCKTTDTTHTRLYYTTTRDIRTIAIRNKVDPARRHDVDAESEEIRIGEKNPDDGIHYYTPAEDDTGEGFASVIITPIQKMWLEKYGARAICLDDTFNLTLYALRLTIVVVADEWDKRLPAAYFGKKFLYFCLRMTENEVALPFKEIKKLINNFDTAFLLSIGTNTFHNGFLRVSPDSLAKKLLCVFRIVQSIERNCKKMTRGRICIRKLSFFHTLNRYKNVAEQLRSHSYWKGVRVMRNIESPRVRNQILHC